MPVFYLKTSCVVVDPPETGTSWILSRLTTNASRPSVS